MKGRIQNKNIFFSKKILIFLLEIQMEINNAFITLNLFWSFIVVYYDGV